MPRPGYVYILASQRNGTLYIGVTSDLAQRLDQHHRAGEGFVRKYGLGRLVYAERYDEIEQARARERQLKKWRRAWKLELMEDRNPYWRDLSREIAP